MKSRRLWRTFRDMRATKKILLLSIFFLALPTLIFSAFLYENQTSQFNKRLIEERKVAIEQLTENIRNTLSSVSELSRDLAYRSPVKDLLVRPNLERFPIWSSRYLSDMVSSIKYSLKYQNYGVEAAYVSYLESDAGEDEYFRDASRMEKLPFFRSFLESGRSLALYHLTGENAINYYASCHDKGNPKHTEIVLLIRTIMDNSGKTLGYIVFEMPASRLFPKLDQYTGEQSGYFIWFENTHSSYGASPPEEMIRFLTETPAESGIIEENGRQYLCESIANFSVVIADGQPVGRMPFASSALNLSLILIWLAIAQMLILNLFIKGTFSRLNTDLNQMDAIVANEFEGRIPVQRQDEAGQIAIRYNVLLDKIHGLISDLVKKETANTAAQLKALQFQINPHFIYNTLNIFSGYSEQRGDWDLAEAIASFGHLLRYNLKSDGLYSTVDTELANARSLISVYSIRYFNRLKLDIQVEPEIRGMRLMKFLIQPILENSILHGMTVSRTSLRLQIAIRQDGGSLEILLRDDGAGMSPHRLEQIREHITGDEHAAVPEGGGSFIGLRNIYERIRLFYGSTALMEIDSRKNNGTQIRIRIPAEHTKRVGLCSMS